MADIFRLRVPWSGSGVVGPGLSTFYCDGGATAANISPAVHTFFEAIKSFFPTGVTWQIPNGGDLIDPTTGLLTGVWTSGGAFTSVGTDASNYAAGTGARITWNTAAILRGRRVKGRLFLVPLTVLSYSGDGTLNNGNRTTIETAANAYTAATGVLPVVWNRPTTPGGTNGTSSLITSASVPDMVTALRTRRV